MLKLCKLKLTMTTTDSLFDIIDMKTLLNNEIIIILTLTRLNVPLELFH